MTESNELHEHHPNITVDLRCESCPHLNSRQRCEEKPQAWQIPKTGLPSFGKVHRTSGTGFGPHAAVPNHQPAFDPYPLHLRNEGSFPIVIPNIR